MGHRIPLLCVNEAWEEKGVTDEEDGGVVAHQVPVTFFGVKLHSKTTWVTCSISRTGFPTYSAESDT